MARYGYEQRDIVRIEVYYLFHRAGLHLLVAVGNNTLSNLNIQRLNFHNYLP